MICSVKSCSVTVMRGIFTFFLLHSSLFLYSQVDYSEKAEKINRRVDHWVHGEVVFKDGKTVECEFSYNPLMPEGLLKMKKDWKLITGTAFNIERFSYLDDKTSERHEYFSMPIDNNQVFVELLHEDTLYAILGRESIYVLKYTQDGYTSSKVRPAYFRYLVNMEDGKIYKLTAKSVVDIMYDRKKEVKKFIRVNRLRFANTQDYVEVINYYILLKSQENDENRFLFSVH